MKYYHFILLLHVFSSLGAQSVFPLEIHHDQPIQDFVLKDDGTILLIDRENTTLSYDGFELSRIQEDFPPQVKIYNPNNATDFEDVYESGDKIFCITDNTIFLYTHARWTQYLVPEFDGLQGFEQVAYDNKLLAFSIDNNIYFFDETNYDYKKTTVSHPVTQLALKNGHIYFLSNGKLNRLSTDRAKSNPIIQIEQISSAGEVLKPENLSIDGDQNLEVRLTLLDINRPAGARIHFTLDDQKTWTPLAELNKVIVLRDLVSGKHSLQFRLTYPNKEVSYTQSYSLQVQAPDFPLWAILVISILGSLLLGVLLANWINNNTMKVMNTETEKLKAKINLLESEQQKLSLQMSPHFMFNALNSIQGLIVTSSPKEAKHHLRNFSLLMRSTLDQSRSQEISLGEEIRYLKRFLEMHNLVREQKFDYTIEIIDLSEDVMIPALITQPLIENAIIHGLKGIENGQITIEYTVENGYLTCSISDNGTGLVSSKKSADPTHKSAAIDITRNRLSTNLRLPKYDVITYLDLNPGTQANVILKKLKK